MTLTLEPPEELEERLRAAAEVMKQGKEAGAIGIWADREDISDSSEFARKLREEAQTRRRD